MSGDHNAKTTTTGFKTGRLWSALAGIVAVLVVLSFFMKDATTSTDTTTTSSASTQTVQKHEATIREGGTVTALPKTSSWEEARAVSVPGGFNLFMNPGPEAVEIQCKGRQDAGWVLFTGEPLNCTHFRFLSKTESEVLVTYWFKMQ